MQAPIPFPRRSDVLIVGALAAGAATALHSPAQGSACSRWTAPEEGADALFDPPAHAGGAAAPVGVPRRGSGRREPPGAPGVLSLRG
jgi:hypothetical protein